MIKYILPFISSIALAQSAGDILFTKKNTSGPSTPIWLTPSANKVIGFDGSGNLVTTNTFNLPSETGSLIVSPTWTDNTKTYNAIYSRVTNTDSGANSRLLSLGTAAGGELFGVAKTGALIIQDSISGGPSLFFTSLTTMGIQRTPGEGGQLVDAGQVPLTWAAGSITVSSNTNIGWGSSGTGYSTPDVVLTRAAANTLAQRNGTAAQEFQVWNKDNPGDNDEWGGLKWDSDKLYLGTWANGTGTIRPIFMDAPYVQLTSGFLYGTAGSPYALELTGDVGLTNQANGRAIYFNPPDGGVRIVGLGKAFGWSSDKSVNSDTMSTRLHRIADGVIGAGGPAANFYGPWTGADQYSGFFQDKYRRYGSGSPEGSVTADVGTVYHRTNGGAGTSLYVKESGTGNTGWKAAQTQTTTKTTAVDYTIGTTNPNELYGGVIYVTGAATITVPAVASGASFTVITVGAVAVNIDPDASDLIYLDGTALSDGDKITNLSTAGDIAVFTYYDGTGWYASTNGWTDGN